MLTITNLLFSLSEFQLLKMYYSMVKFLNSINHIRHQLLFIPTGKTNKYDLVYSAMEHYERYRTSVENYTLRLCRINISLIFSNK